MIFIIYKILHEKRKYNSESKYSQVMNNWCTVINQQYMKIVDLTGTSAKVYKFPVKSGVNNLQKTQSLKNKEFELWPVLD